MSFQSIPTRVKVSNSSINVNPRAPNIAGTESKKENLKAFFLFIPSKSAMEMVSPLRDIPGIKATPWAMPITKELR